MLYLNREIGVDHVFLCDDALTVIPARVTAICDLLDAAGFSGTWSASSRTDGVTEQTLTRMAAAHCTSVSFGVESGDQEVLDAINKRIRLADVTRAVRWATEAGMHVKCNFVIGHHADTPRTIRTTLDFARALKRDFGASTPLGINTPFPGTPLRDRAAELGVTVLSDEWSDYTFDHCVIETANLTSYEIQRWYFQGLLELASELPAAKDLLATLAPAAATVASAGTDSVAPHLVDMLMVTSLVSRKHYTPWITTAVTAEAGIW
jgi:anaerobic magnesium-protoporphyrin IX monomethyl ester cyclase